MGGACFDEVGEIYFCSETFTNADSLCLWNQVGRLENVVGWYHSHPGYGCWLSGIDVSTQMLNQQYQEPFLAVVIDPTRTVSAGKVEIGAFRTYPTGFKPADEPPSEYQTIPLNKIEDFGVHYKQVLAYHQLFYCKCELCLTCVKGLCVDVVNIGFSRFLVSDGLSKLVVVFPRVYRTSNFPALHVIILTRVGITLWVAYATKGEPCIFYCKFSSVALDGRVHDVFLWLTNALVVDLFGSIIHLILPISSHLWTRICWISFGISTGWTHCHPRRFLATENMWLGKCQILVNLFRRTLGNVDHSEF